MPHLGVPELLIIFILVFGMGWLPQIGKAVGRGIRQFKEATQGLREEDSAQAAPDEKAKA